MCSSVCCGGFCISLVCPGINRLLVHHTTQLTATIHLKDKSGIVQIHLRILCPGVLTVTGTIDRGKVLVFLIVINRSIDVYVTIECAAIAVVATVDTRTIATHESIAAAPIDV